MERELMLLQNLVLPAVAKPACAFVALHGLTDFDRPIRTWSVCYGATLLMHPPYLMPLFVAASTVHFSKDVGFRTSVLMHVCFLLSFTDLLSYNTAMCGLFLYMCVVHVPLHYSRKLREGLSMGVCIALVTSIAAATTNLVFQDPVVLSWNDWTERLVVGHILCEMEDHKQS